MAEVFGLTETSLFDSATIFGSRVIVTPTTSTIDSPAFISPFKVDTQLVNAAARIAAVAGLFPSLANRVDPPTADIYGYDEQGNLLILEDQNDSEIFQLFDAVDRRFAVRVFRSGQPDSHLGDPIFAPAPLSDPSNPTTIIPAVVGTTRQNFEYDGRSRMTRATDNNEPLSILEDSIVTRAYDGLGRVIEETQRIGTTPVRLIDYGWRAENLNFSVTYPNERVVERTFDLVDRVDKVRDAGAPLPIADYDWIGQSRILVRAVPINGTRMTHLDFSGTIDVGYDGVRRPTFVQHLRNDNSLIVGTDNQWDRTGNLLHELKLHDPISGEFRRYDSAYRLVGFDRPNPQQQPLHSNWVLDGAGNWQQVDAEVRQHSSQNEIIQQNATPLASDDNGNLNNDTQYLFRYDFLNQLRTVTRQLGELPVAQDSYDALGRRIQHVVTDSGALNGTTKFSYASSQVIEERNAVNQLTQQYVWGATGEPLVLDRNLNNGDDSAIGPGDQRLFYHENVQGSVYAVTNQAGQIVEGCMFDAHGRQFVFQPGPNGTVDFGADDHILPSGHSAVGNPYLYAAQRLDAATDLVLINGRHFHTELGRYLTRDYNVVGMTDTSHQDPENARLFAVASIAQADSAIAAWDARYQNDFWRPVTAIASHQDSESGWRSKPVLDWTSADYADYHRWKREQVDRESEMWGGFLNPHEAWMSRFYGGGVMVVTASGPSVPTGPYMSENDTRDLINSERIRIGSDIPSLWFPWDWADFDSAFFTKINSGKYWVLDGYVMAGWEVNYYFIGMAARQNGLMWQTTEALIYAWNWGFQGITSYFGEGDPMITDNMLHAAFLGWCEG